MPGPYSKFGYVFFRKHLYVIVKLDAINLEKSLFTNLIFTILAICHVFKGTLKVTGKGFPN